jgi:transposase-like protein
MSDPLCRDCLERGSEVKATRIVRTTPVCDAHMRERLGMPAVRPFNVIAAKTNLALDEEQAPEQRRQSMAKRIDEETRKEILAHHAAGMSINAIARKHDISWPTARNIIAVWGKSKRSSVSRLRAPKASRAPTVDQRNGYIHGILESLLALQAKLDSAIRALEELE